MRKQQGPGWIIFPEIDSITQPIVIIFTVIELCFSGDYSLANSTVTAMETEDELWITGVQNYL